NSFRDLFGQRCESYLLKLQGNTSKSFGSITLLSCYLDFYNKEGKI
ncbi:MAG: hypothetical protein ACJAXF_003142, partial [Polaribacter sp.]